MNRRLTSMETVVLLLVAATFVVGFLVLPSMPDRMPSHWNASGEVDGYAPRTLGVFLMPGILFLLFLLFVAIPRIDPLRANIAQFRKAYEAFFACLMLFLTALYVHTLLWGAGIHLNTNMLVGAGVGALVYCTGVLCGHAKRNYFVGIRTPWTLNSDRVWDKTHRLGARLLRVAGVLTCAGILFPQLMLWFVLVPVMTSALVLVVYSYLEYEREERTRFLS